MSRENVQMARRLVTAVHDRDLATLLDLTDPDVEWQSFYAIGRGGGAHCGHDSMVQYLRDLDEAFEWVYPAISDVLDAGDVVLAIGSIAFRGRQSGVETSVRVGWVFKFRRGCLIRFRPFRDPEETLEAVGLSD